MTQVIIHQTENGNVALTIPTGEISIEAVLAKDCPKGALIVEKSSLPQGNDALFFDAWELSNNTITVNFEKAKVIKLKQFNDNAVIETQKRQLNSLAGISNNIDDETWLNNLIAKRLAIESASTTSELVEI